MFKKFLLVLVVLTVTAAQAFTPPKTVEAVIGFAPGSGNEISFRQVAALIEKASPTNPRFVIMNKPGADELIALDYFMRLDPASGGHLYVVSQNNLATLDAWFPNRLPKDLLDLEFVTNIAKSPLCIVANASSPTNTPKEFLDRLKNTKTPINIGLGSAGQKLVFEYIMDNVKGDTDKVKSILYKGPGPVLQDLAGNQIDFAIIPSAVAAPLAKAGKVKFIAITSEYKLAQIPEVPLMKDYIKDLNFYAAWGIALPAGSSKEQIKYYQELFVPFIRSEEAKRFFDDNLMLVFPNEHTPEGLRRTVIKTKEMWFPYAKKISLDK
jgi:tripartite-type tricarboxylate transporter receptor subunit TctC